MVAVTAGIVLADLQILRGQHPLHICGQLLQTFYDPAVFFFLDRTQFPGHIQGQQVHHRKLGGERLGGSHRNLRACPGVDGVVRSLGNGRAHHIDDCKRLSAQTLGFSKCCQGIRSFTGLADNDHQIALIDNRIGISELRGHHRLCGNAAGLFDGVLGKNGNIISRTAGHQIDLTDIFQIRLIQLQALKHHLSIPDTGIDGIPQSLGLLKDLLEHKVVIATALRCGKFPGNGFMLLFHRVTLSVQEYHIFGIEDSHITVIHIGNRLGIFQNGRNIRCNKVFSISEAKDQRRILLHRNYRSRAVFTHDRQRETALQTGHSQPNRCHKVLALVIIIANEVGNHFRIRIGTELDTVVLQSCPKYRFIFNNTVVNDSDLAGIGQMGMAVHIRGGAMGGPAGMADAHHTGGILSFLCFFAQSAQPALSLGYRKTFLILNANSSGIISAIFQFAQPIQKNGGSLPVTGIANNSTHGDCLLSAH